MRRTRYSTLGVVAVLVAGLGSGPAVADDEKVMKKRVVVEVAEDHGTPEKTSGAESFIAIR